jgi:hypothetical protein
MGLDVPVAATARLETNGGDDAVVAESGAGAAIRLEFHYGAGGDLNADFSRYNAISMFFDTLPGEGLFETELVSGSGTGTASIDSFGLNDVDWSPGEVRFEFDHPAFSSVDFSDIDQARFTVTTDFDNRFALAEVTPIPLPAAAWPALCTMGVLIGARARRFATRKRTH